MTQTQQLIDADVTGSLEGQDCQFCAEGSVRKGTYKENDAAVCDSCGLPVAQVWS
ncbi:HVO_A0556 family zinc finger protein [Natrarchaeobius sp. A-rgal3]|uniref:HVO_A0556 family zinc finger protein n=1 Tax=Natrarchaeobius versutus TaxID=1679078 RepID=UPI00350F8997